MAKAGSVDVQGQKATIVLLTQSVEDDEKVGESILGGMLPMDESRTLFVKFRGPAEVARKEQKRFVAFMASLRLPQRSQILRITTGFEAVIVSSLKTVVAIS